MRPLTLAALAIGLVGCHTAAQKPVARAAIEAEASRPASVAAVITSVRFVPSAREADCGVSAMVAALEKANVHFTSDEIVRQGVVDPERDGAPVSAMVRFAREQKVFGLVREFWYLEDLKDWVRSGVPPIVLLSLEPLGVGQYHYLLLTGYDDSRRVFLLQDNTSRDVTIPYAAFSERWCHAKGWALVVCDPSIEHPPATLTAPEFGALGWLAEQKGDYAAARRHYRSALVKDPSYQPAAQNLENVDRKFNSP